MAKTELDKKIDKLGKKYRMGMIAKTIAPIDTIDWWTARYKIAMRIVLQKRHRR